ncbi:MAG: Asp23/Gls24 family envelope stress response protein [Chloroflexi bacterium]|nr:Asp23/Gls24 family envelope stress response protein [Chloroflexota bacterium]MCL5074102.1 Asp23/Gls24 family envelope stress response protein [Chloroflexota bacterium]
MQPNLGSIHISASVLATIARLTALSVPGIVGMSSDPICGLFRLCTRGRPRGVELRIEDESVYIDLYIIVEHGVNMLETGSRLQQQVAEAISTMVSMTVKEVNVYIRDVR